MFLLPAEQQVKSVKTRSQCQLLIAIFYSSLQLWEAAANETAQRADQLAYCLNCLEIVSAVGSCSGHFRLQLFKLLVLCSSSEKLQVNLQ